MATIIQDLLIFLGLDYSPATFADFLPWFVGVCIGVSLLMYVIDGMLYVCRSIGKGGGV